MRSPSPSSTALADTLTTSHKEIQQLFEDVKQRAKADVAHATTVSRGLTEERDKAFQSLRKAQQGEKKWKKELENCRATLHQAELTIAHHAELIFRLQSEVAQLKDMSDNWRNHFLNSEQEKCRLSTRLDELVSQRVMDFDPSSSNLPPAYKPAESPQPLIQPKPSKATPRASTKPRKSLTNQHQAKPSAQPQPKHQRPAERSEPRQISVRRVHAVVNVTLKSEDDDDDNGLLNFHGDQRPVSMPAAIKKRRLSRNQSRIIESDEEPAESNREEVDDKYEHSEGDDELMLGAEDRESTLKIPERAVNHKTVTSSTPGSNKKRKLASVVPTKPTPGNTLKK